VAFGVGANFLFPHDVAFLGPDYLESTPQSGSFSFKKAKLAANATK